EEISRAVLVATATSVVVFMPTLFVSGDFWSRIQSEFALVVCALLATPNQGFSALESLGTQLIRRFHQHNSTVDRQATQDEHAQ
ncbi:hypothetical protein C2W62_53820, partial [Candidatus Entotheonella serta]